MVNISASQADAPGSIPGCRSIVYIILYTKRGCSSVGRARALQARGTGIETRHLQESIYIIHCSVSSISLVVTTPLCGRGSPGSNPGWNM